MAISYGKSRQITGGKKTTTVGKPARTAGPVSIEKNSIGVSSNSMERPGRAVPSVTSLRVFDAICRGGSAVRAARELGVTPGAVSRQIKNLERDVGCALFTRSNARLALTTLGQRYRDHVVPAFDRIESATRELYDATRGGPLTVACLPTFTLLWLVPRLVSFVRRYPRTELRLVSLTDQDVAWGKAGIDAMIDVGRWPIRRDLIQTGFMSDNSGLVASPAYWTSLAQKGDGDETLDRLSRATFLCTRSRPHLWLSWSENSGHLLPEDRREIWLDHLYLVLEAAKSGLGIAPIPGIYVHRELAEGTLIAPLGFAAKPVPFYMAWQSSRTGDRRLRSFMSWLRSEGKRGAVKQASSSPLSRPAQRVSTR